MANPTKTTDIVQIDGHYMRAGRAAAYLIHDGQEAAFIDNITRFSIPYLLETLQHQGLKPEQVRYAIVTHIHLDHSGGTAELLKHCPNATVICHPRAQRHIVDPTRLVAGARTVYGDQEFDKLYGEIEPVDAARVTSLKDGATLQLGARTFSFYDSPGHARHHFVIHDSKTNSMLTGDAFGGGYPQLQAGARAYMNYVCAPPQFDPPAAIRTIRRIMDMQPERVCTTHFGVHQHVAQGGERLIAALERFDALANRAAETDFEGDALHQFCAEGCLEITLDEVRACGLDPQDHEIRFWATAEHKISSSGVAILAEQRREAG